MKLYVIAGEASGDLHGSNLIKAIKRQEPDADIRAWGGDLMMKAGANVVKHIRDLAFMGFVEVVANLGTILSNISNCKQDILAFQPDALVLIDYPGFNLRIAKWAKANNIKVFYYISPQIWAWNQKRGYKIRKVVDKMFVILPFEEAFYERFDFKVEFVGHPLLDAVSEYRSERPDFELFCKENQLENRPIIALLPGSRKQEVAKMLPVFLSIQDQFPKHQFVLAAAPSLDDDFYAPYLKGRSIPKVKGKTYQLLLQSKAALVSSGTATLETALFRVPQVVCYKGGWLSYFIARMLIKVRFISLVNLIMDKEIVTELIQAQFNAKNLSKELGLLVKNDENRNRILSDYDELIEKLGGSGASEITANSMLKTLNHSV